MAIHAVTIAIQQRLIADVTALQGSIDLRVAPPLCPLSVSPIDFRHTGRLIERAHAATSAWLDQPIPADQASDLAMHSHPTADTHADSRGPS
jgi:NTE family protein